MKDHPAIKDLQALLERHRVAAIGCANGAAALIVLLMIAGFAGRASRASAEARGVMIERTYEEARAPRATRGAPPARGPRTPRVRRAEPAPTREYEVQVRDGSVMPVEHPPAGDVPPELRSEPMPPAGAGDPDEVELPEH
jgi:hypothetical protein